MGGFRVPGWSTGGVELERWEGLEYQGRGWSRERWEGKRMTIKLEAGGEHFV